MQTHLRLIGSLVFFLASQHAALADMKLSSEAKLHFATVAEGQQVLTRPDDFSKRLSPFDLAARLKSDAEVTADDYLKLVGKSIRPWEPEEKQQLKSVFEGVQQSLQAYNLPFPKRVLLVKTTGDEEGGAAYTRANAIVFPQHYLQKPLAEIQSTLCHELFHVLSRQNPQLRDQLYAIIGFESCGEVELPPKLAIRKLTNPDAPCNEHCIRIQYQDEPRWALPVLIANQEKYDPKRGGSIFAYLQLKLLLVERPKKGEPGKTTVATNPQLVDMWQASGYMDQIGNNTTYIIHAEEILAENFALLITEGQPLASPEIVEKMQAVLEKCQEGDKQ